jgi:superfamily II DNA or RNA helicase
MFTLREHQQQAVELALTKPPGGTLTAVIPPGGGKTILALAVLDALHKAGRIDAAVVFTPRLGLCAQFELDWKSVRSQFGPDPMGSLVHRTNESVHSLRSFGYITSYQSLCAAPEVHRRYARRKAGRLAIVCDEAHYLGEELYGNGETTQAAKILANIDKYAAFKLVMTGTPYRADENPIVFADYDDFGRIRADVQLSYGDGVRQGFLRPFDAMLFDGTLSQTRRRQRNGHAYYVEEEVELRHTAQQLTKVATDPQFWQVAARRALEKVKALQVLWPHYCGIAGCATQEHAREVLAYLQGLGARCLLAVSDDSQAHENLRRFKRGGYDMLVTVGMAHVGYDHRPIAVAAVLNGVREYNWLDQFTMRAGRVLPNRPLAEQAAWIVGMNDRSMREYVRAKREEAERAIRTRKEEEEEPGLSFGNSQSYGPSLLYNGVTLDSISGMGLEHNGYIEDLDEALDLPPDDEFAHLTEGEQGEVLRRRRQGLVNQYAAIKFKRINGDTLRQVNSLLITRYGKPVNRCTVDELREQITWLEETLGIDPTAPTPADPLPDERDFWVQGGLFG